jgi:hypothetical protein
MLTQEVSVLCTSRISDLTFKETPYTFADAQLHVLSPTTTDFGPRIPILKTQLAGSSPALIPSSNLPTLIPSHVIAEPYHTYAQIRSPGQTTAGQLRRPRTTALLPPPRADPPSMHSSTRLARIRGRWLARRGRELSPSPQIENAPAQERSVCRHLGSLFRFRLYTWLEGWTLDMSSHRSRHMKDCWLPLRET